MAHLGGEWDLVPLWAPLFIFFLLFVFSRFFVFFLAFYLFMFSLFLFISSFFDFTMFFIFFFLFFSLSLFPFFSFSHFLFFSFSHFLIFSFSHLLFCSSALLLFFSSSLLLFFSSSLLLFFSSSLRLDTSGEWDDTWSHGDEMTHGCHFWCRGDRPRAGEHAILTPSPTGAGPPALSLRTGPKTPPFRKEPRRDISKGTLHPNHFARGLPSNQVSACNKPVTCSSE